MRWESSSYPGVRFRKHPTRKHGVNFDRYFAVRYQKEGKRCEEGLGWSSEGWTAEKAAEELSRLKRNARTGEGPQRLSEARSVEQQRRQEEEARQAAEKIASMTVSEFFLNTYLPHAKDHKKLDTWKFEERIFRLWIAPVMGDLPFAKVAPIHLDKIKSNMRQGKREDTAPTKSKPRPLRPKTINDALAVVRQVWNHARREGIVKGDWPGRDVKKPKVSNARTRFLTHEEADRLFSALKSASSRLHDMALISLHCGLRFGEIAALTWDCVNFEDDSLLLLDTKNSETRHAFMTQPVKDMLSSRFAKEFGKGQSIGKPDLSGHVFTNRKGQKVAEVSAAFTRIVDRIGLNDGVADPRRKVTFHTLRHTFASWLVESGTDLYTTGKMLGHKTVHMTARYSHVGENTQRQASRALAEKIEAAKQQGKVVNLHSKGD